MRVLAILGLWAVAVAGQDLTGTSWRLVQFQSGDGKVMKPDDRSKYTLTFSKDGRVAARIDCNRGKGTWKSTGENRLEFGQMAVSRAMCPPGSMHDRIIKDLPAVRSYVIKDGHLHLSLYADGGIYEFEPISTSKAMSIGVTSRGPFTFNCGGDSIKATFYQTQPAFVLLERNGETKPAFQVEAASGAKYEGEDVMFWEARGEATVNWSGSEMKCKIK